MLLITLQLLQFYIKIADYRLHLIRAVPELNVWKGRAAASFFLHEWLVV
jgi:hypothetical protein